MRPPVLILHATGTNRDREVAWAVALAGGAPEIVHVNQLVAGERRLTDYRMMVLPGGFSYGDDLGAGRLWALDLLHRLADDVVDFARRRRPVLGICNGFQALVKAGVLPGGNNLSPPPSPSSPPLGERRGRGGGEERSAPLATLTRNASGRFECRWVWLRPQNDSRCLFTQGLEEMIYCPVAHGEGNFVPRDDAVLHALQANGQIALTYAVPDGSAADYPWNPNGSVASIAGVCDAGGTILGLMPHPEDHIMPEQRPDFARGGRGNLGLALWQKAVRYAAEV
ncbi:MAG: phosphoribosylformylglycinamidine synthase I [Anaerolineae bacterium]|nr:phosphoribosylformylglycinamidine synthase I [Anaerolineae bacterium]